MIAVLHTAQATVPMLAKMIQNIYPEEKVYHWLDDSILPMLSEDKGTLPYIFEKMLFYAKSAENQGAKVILNACSSVGEFQDYVGGKISIPIVRIDDAITDLLAETYASVGVLATLETTLAPSAALIRKKKPGISLDFQVVEGAWEAAMAGDKEKQYRLIGKKAEDFLQEKDAVFFAQASMAEAKKFLSQECQRREYTSPEYGVGSLKKYL